MFELKPIHREAIPAALAKAERYRLLNQPRQAESICHDILRVDPKNQPAQVMLLLCLTDQFGRKGYHAGLKQAQEVLANLEGEYEKLYYEGLISERWGKSLLSGTSSVNSAVDWIRHAMDLFEKARAKSPPGNDDAILRWNACARLITRLEESGSLSPDTDFESGFRDDVPQG
jgi:hypothetical protein